MFFIVNKTKSNIIIKDLSVKLGPRQAIDLDKIISRKKSENSLNLKTAKEKGQIEIRIKDGFKNALPTKRKKVDNGLDSLKNEIVGEVKDMMKSMSRELMEQQLQNKYQGIDAGDLENIFKKVVQSIPKTETVVIREGGVDVPQGEEVEMDEETLSLINARTVDGIVKNVKLNNVRYKESIEQNDIEQNVSELEDLLG